MIGAMRGNVTRRGPDTWRLRIYLGRGPNGNQRFLSRTIHGTEDDAHRALHRLLVETADGHHQSDQHTVTELVNRWYALTVPDLAPYTARDYRSVIDRWIIPGLGHTLVDKLRPHRLEHWYSTLELGPARVRRVHQVLAGAFDAAVRWQWTTTNPCRLARRPKMVEAEVHPPAPDDVRRLLEAASADPDFAAYLQLAASTGARRGELCGLRWSDVDLEHGSLTVRRSVAQLGAQLIEKRPKNNTSRAVALPKTVVADLKAMRTRQAERALAVGHRLDDGPVFTSDPAGGTGWRPETVSRKFRRLADKAKVPGVRLHDLRHYVATRMLVAGADPRTVAGRLGHKQMRMLDRYAHFVTDADRQAAEDLAALLD
jgi:integrase